MATLGRGWCLAMGWLLCSWVHGAAATLEQQANRLDFQVGACVVAEFTVEVRLAESYGEPVVTARTRWQPGPGGAADCLSSDPPIQLRIDVPNDSPVFLRIDAEVGAAGAWAPSVTVSRDWDQLFCTAADPGSPCLPASAARSVMAANLRVAELLVGAASQSPTSRPSRPVAALAADTESLGGAGSLDDRLAASVLEMLAPEDRLEAEAALRRDRRDRLAPTAEIAVTNIVSLLDRVGRYETPERNCESGRAVQLQALAKGYCQLEFRAQFAHSFTCTDTGKPRAIRRQESAAVDFRRDVREIQDPRISAEGWLALVLELNDDLVRVGQQPGAVKMSRLQLTLPARQIQEIGQLADNLNALRAHCGGAS